MAQTPFGGILEGFLSARETQMRQAQLLADELFREQAAKLNQKEFEFRKNESVARAKEREEDLQFRQDQNDWNQMMDWQKFNEDAFQFDQSQKRFEEDRKQRAETATMQAKGREQAVMMKDRNRALLSWVQAGGDPYAFDAVWGAMQQSQVSPQNPAQEAQKAQKVPDLMQLVPPPSNAPGFDIESLIGDLGPQQAGQTGQGGSGFAMPPGWQAKIDNAAASAQSKAAYAEKTRVMTPLQAQNMQATTTLKQAQKAQVEANVRRLQQLLPQQIAEIQAKVGHIVRQDELDAQRIGLQRERLQLDKDIKTGKIAGPQVRQRAMSTQSSLMEQKRKLQSERMEWETALKSNADLLSQPEPTDGDAEVLKQRQYARASMGARDPRTGRWNGPIQARIDQINAMGKDIDKLLYQNRPYLQTEATMREVTKGGAPVQKGEKPKVPGKYTPGTQEFYRGKTRPNTYLNDKPKLQRGKPADQSKKIPRGEVKFKSASELGLFGK